MNVKNILKITSTLLQMDDVNSALSAEIYNPSSDIEAEIKNMLASLNYVISIVACDYYPVIAKKEITTTNGIISNSNICSTNQILGVKKVLSENSTNLEFKTTYDGIETRSGKVNVIYAYFPADVTISSDFDYFPIKLTERIFAYGVAGEYLFMKGNVDDASMWDLRFKEALRSALKPIHSIILKSN